MEVSTKRARRSGPAYGFLTEILCALLWIALSALPAHAHRVTVFAWIEGGKIHTESKFSGGRPAKNALVEVVDENGAVLLTGRSDAKGAFSFPPPRTTGLTIVLKAGSGHQGSWSLTREEMEAGFGQLQPNPSAGEDASETGDPKTAAAPNMEDSHSDRSARSQLTEAQVQAAFEKALDRKLKPVLDRLSRLEKAGEGPGIRDVLGGIGYILGLVGIAAYVGYRKKAGHDDR